MNDRSTQHFRPPLAAEWHMRGPFPVLMRGILQSDICLRRGPYQRAYVDKQLADPEAQFSRIHGSKLWHLAVLEWLLQANAHCVADHV